MDFSLFQWTNTACCSYLMNRFFCCFQFVALHLQRFKASRAETLVDHSFGYLDKENVIKWNLKNVLTYWADLVTHNDVISEVVTRAERYYRFSDIS